MNDIVDILKKKCLATESEIVGYTDKEIALLESHFGNLPRSFVEFLRKMGHEAGDFFWELEMLFDSWEGYLYLRDCRCWLDTFHGKYDLSEQDFVFASRYATTLLFFDKESSCDDPPVFFCTSSMKSRVMDAPSFTKFLEQEAHYYSPGDPKMRQPKQTMNWRDAWALTKYELEHDPPWEDA